MTSRSRKERFNRDGETDFALLAERATSRRRFLGATVAFGAAAFLTGGRNDPAIAAEVGRFAFTPVAANARDTITLPPGYRWRVLARWGDPLWSQNTPFNPVHRGDGLSSERAFGDNNDGMELFTHQGRTILAVNHEYVNLDVAFDNRWSGKPETTDDIRKCQALHGVSVCEIAQRGQNWEIVKDSPYNRRITPNTPMAITGPARGHRWMKTAADPQGVMARGTWSNCGAGRTPWGTYLTCEENFNGYFSSSDAGFDRGDDLKRYGVGKKDRGYGWAGADDRFDVSKHPHEPNRAGYIVEIDPLDPNSTPKKRTALGRLKHENAEVVLAADGHVIVYMGDDERGEFLYKFISAGRYVEGGDNDDLLASGQLFAAKFQDNGGGSWVELTPESTGMPSQAEICIHTRQAASAVGATTMDRPEWVAAHPHRAEVYCSLTHNKNRGRKPNAGGDATPVGGPNPREANKYGQIVRW
ncbi:MAG: PhoX family phosphatase, partial [Alphaproteobacteria bacterium]|nr:PhoX family phosphatase [Alphaproteobacteria bacterium]